MQKVKIYNKKGETIGEEKLSDTLFSVELNQGLIHQAMVAQTANQRQVLAHTKDRSEVRGGGKKPWRQKGTGRARAGSSRSPIWIGGGVTFGPLKERNFSKKINTKMKQKALFMVLSNKILTGNLIILDKLEMEKFKTKDFLSVVENLEKKPLKAGKDKKAKNNIIFIDRKSDIKVKNSSRNLEGIKVINLDNINIVDLLKYKNVVFVQEALKGFEKKYKK